MSPAAATPAQLPPVWREALEQVRRRRFKRHYKPAALLVALDLLDLSGDAVSGRVPWEQFDSQFEDLLGTFDPHAKGKGWQPFFHLSTGDQVWDLFRDGRQVTRGENVEHVSRSMADSMATRLVSDL